MIIIIYIDLNSCSNYRKVWSSPLLILYRCDFIPPFYYLLYVFFVFFVYLLLLFQLVYILISRSSFPLSYNPILVTNFFIPGLKRFWLFSMVLYLRTSRSLEFLLFIFISVRMDTSFWWLLVSISVLEFSSIHFSVQ